MTDRPTYSIVAPVYNEEGNILRLHSEIHRVMEQGRAKPGNLYS